MGKATGFLAFCGALLVLLATASVAASAPLSIAVDGSHFVNGDGQSIRLLGVNHPSAEYACVDGFGYNDDHQDAADAAAIASWAANAVRVPLNEDCWLGINGQPNSDGGADEILTPAGYRQAVESYVAALNAHGLYAILDLHWTAPGTQVAMEQQPMPDKDHSLLFWQKVAEAFKGNPAVVFDVFNEPFDPTDPRSGDDQEPTDKVTWNCWATGTENGAGGGGPCLTSAYDESGEKTSLYQVAGMQDLVDAIRAAGATQPVLVGGLDYANDLTGWLDHAPDDPLNQEAASFHNYMGKECDNIGCWEAQITPVAANVPVVTGEFDEDNFENPTCNDKNPNTFGQDYMNWADQHGIGYLAWGWWVLSPQEIADAGCSAFYLLTDWNGTPASPNGTNLHDHLLKLKSGGGGDSRTIPPGGTKRAIHIRRFATNGITDGKKVSFTVIAGQDCRGRIVGKSTKAIAAAVKRPKKLALGATGFTLTANKPTKVVLRLSAPARRALAAKGSLRAAFTLTLSSPGRKTTVRHLSTMLKKAAKKRHRK